jgi:hypothetical protein
MKAQPHVTPTKLPVAFENLGASFNAAAYRDMFLVDLRVLSENNYLDPALDVFSDVLPILAFLKSLLIVFLMAHKSGNNKKNNRLLLKLVFCFINNCMANTLTHTHQTAHPKALKALVLMT